MRSVLVVARHYRPAPGAATVRLGALVDEALMRGWRVDVVTGSAASSDGPATGESSDVAIPGLTVHRVPGDSRRGVGARRVAELWRFGRAVGEVARRLPPADLVVSDPPPTAGTAAGAVARRWGVPDVYYYADSWADMVAQSGGGLASAIGPAVARAERRALRDAAVVVAVTARLQAKAARARAGGDRTLLVPNGTDLADFSADGPTWDDPWGGARPYVLYAGNLGVVHGATVFLEAAERVWARGVDVGLVVMGYGVDRPAFDEAARRFGDRLVVLDPQPPAVAAAAFRGALAGLASVRPLAVTGDARPAKAVASVACGCPVLYAGDGEFARTVADDRLGTAVPYDVDAVADALEGWVRDPAPRDCARLATYARVRFDQRAAAGDLLDDLAGEVLDDLAG